MRAVGRDGTGVWQNWRVGRRRLAWRPRFHGWLPRDGPNGADDLILLVFLVEALPAVGYLLNWAGALVLTPVVWPWRALTGRWRVVAYPFDGSERRPPGRWTVVRGRAAADAVVRRWVREIETGGLPGPPDLGASIPSNPDR